MLGHAYPLIYSLVYYRRQLKLGEGSTMLAEAEFFLIFPD